MIIGISGKIGSGKDTAAHIANWLIWKEKFHPNDEEVKYHPAWYRKESDNCGFEIKKFAGKLKQIVSLLTGCNPNDLENQEFKDKLLPDEWSFWVQHQDIGGRMSVRMTPKFESEEAGKKEAATYPGCTNSFSQGINTYRAMLQQVGTDAMREVIHRNVWVNALFADYIGEEDWVDTAMGGEPEPVTVYPNWIITDVRFPNEAEAIKQRGGTLIRIERNWRFEHGLKIIHNLIPKADQHPSETGLDDYKFDHVIENDGTIEELIEKVRQVLISEKLLQA